MFPDILREFNPSLRGYSVGTGNEDSPGAFLNQAVAGDRAEWAGELGDEQHRSSEDLLGGLAWDVWLKAGGLGLGEGSEGQRLDQVSLLGVSIAVEHTKLLAHPQLYPKN